MRKGESSNFIGVRSDRFFYMNGSWYFCVRELIDPIGNFQSKELAEQALKRYVSQCSGEYLGDALNYSTDIWKNR